MTPAKALASEYFARLERDDDSAFALLAADLVNHAAGPQGRDGMRQIMTVLRHDLEIDGVEHHHLIGEGEYCTQHLSLTGIHRGSTMPLLHGTPVSGARISWRFMHIWRAADGLLAEHWACRDDHGLLTQIQTHLRGTGN
jgi:predicted ester cyclase